MKKIVSQARVIPFRWTHIVIIRDKNTFTLWINGIKDSQFTAEKKLFFGEEINHSLRIGSTFEEEFNNYNEKKEENMKKSEEELQEELKRYNEKNYMYF